MFFAAEVNIPGRVVVEIDTLFPRLGHTLSTDCWYFP